MADMDIMPIGDAVAHAYGHDCICGPRVEFWRKGGRDWWVHVHFSLDNREALEDQGLEGKPWEVSRDP